MHVDPGAEVDEDLKVKGDLLVRILCQRYKTFLKQRIRQKTRCDYWSMQFAHNNLHVVAAVMILSGHLKTDLECLKERDSLLITNSSCFVKCENCPDHEGTHVF